MKQFIYRRLGETGYGVSAQTKDLASSRREAARSRIAPFGSTADGWMAPGELCVYRQFRLDEGSLALSCGYVDPRGERHSYLAQTLITASAEETEEYLGILPARTDFFKRQFVTDQVYASAAENVEVRSLAADAAMRPQDACQVLKNAFGSEALLKDMLEALLDAASGNGRFIVAFLPGENVSAISEQGRVLAESLTACLPAQIAASVGWLSFARSDESNAAFGLRFASRRHFSFENAEDMAYVFDMEKGECVRPAKTLSGAGDWAGAIAAGVMKGEDADWTRIRALREALDDAGYYRSKDVPGMLRLRWQVATRPDLSEADVLAQLTWHRGMIDRAADSDAPAEALEKNPFWAGNDAIAREALSSMWENRAAWTPAGRKTVGELLADAQRLHAFGCAAAGYYGGFIYNAFADEKFFAHDQDIADAAVADYFCRTAEDARGPADLDGYLYWRAAEMRMRTQWLEKAIADESAAGAVRRAYRALELLAEQGMDVDDAYVSAFARFMIHRGDALYQSAESGLHSAVVEEIIRLDPEHFIGVMRADIRNIGLFGGPEGEVRALADWYRSHAVNCPQIAEALDGLCREGFEAELARLDLGSLLDAMLGRTPNALLERMQLIADAAEARRAEEQMARRTDELCAQVTKAQIVERYPAERELACSIHAWEKRNGTGRDCVEALEYVNDLDPAALAPEDADQYGELLIRYQRDEQMLDKLHELLCAATARAFAGNENVSGEALVLALAMSSMEAYMRDITFTPAESLAALELLENGKQLAARVLIPFCRAQMRSEPESRLTYLAVSIARCLKTPEKHRRIEALPFELPGEQERAGIEARRYRTLADKIPTAALIAGVALAGSGFVACALGLLKISGIF